MKTRSSGGGIDTSGRIVALNRVDHFTPFFRGLNPNLLAIGLGKRALSSESNQSQSHIASVINATKSDSVGLRAVIAMSRSICTALWATTGMCSALSPSSLNRALIPIFACKFLTYRWHRLQSTIPLVFPLTAKRLWPVRLRNWVC